MTMAVGRLKRRADYLRVAGGRRRSATPGLVLQARRHPRENDPATMQEQLRVGFTASRKVGRAVERNRARRRLKAVAEKVLPTHGKAGYDYVIIARRGTLGRPFPALVADLEQALQRVESTPAKSGRDHRSRGRGRSR